MTERIFTARELADCAERELRLRRRVYPKWVESKKMSPKFAEDEIAKMEAIANILHEQDKGERLI